MSPTIKTFHHYWHYHFCAQDSMLKVPNVTNLQKKERKTKKKKLTTLELTWPVYKIEAYAEDL